MLQLNEQAVEQLVTRADGVLDVHSVFRWRWIAGYRGIYKASGRGRIKSVDRRLSLRDGRSRWVKGKVLKPSPHSSGYLVLSLCKDGVETSVLAHRIIAEVFLPNPDNKPEVNHKDGNKHNNAVANLEWVTHLENEEHAKTAGLKASGSRCWKCTLHESEIKGVLRRIAAGERQCDIADDLQVSRVVINNIWKGKRKIK